MNPKVLQEGFELLRAFEDYEIPADILSNVLDDLTVKVSSDNLRPTEQIALAFRLVCRELRLHAYAHG